MSFLSGNFNGYFINFGKIKKKTFFNIRSVGHFAYRNLEAVMATCGEDGLRVWELRTGLNCSFHLISNP